MRYYYWIKSDKHLSLMMEFYGTKRCTKLSTSYSKINYKLGESSWTVLVDLTADPFNWSLYDNELL